MTKRQSKTIQRVEITKHEISIHCPFCGIKTYEPETLSDVGISKCEHLLFFADDMGLDYRSEHFDQVMGTTGLSEEEIDTADEGIDAFTDKLEVVDGVKFAIFQGPPSRYGTYIGYAPVQE